MCLLLYGSMENNKLGPASGQEFAAALKTTSTMESVNLRKNNLGKEGGIEIGKALAVNKTVENIKYAVATLTLCFIESLEPSVLG